MPKRRLKRRQRRDIGLKSSLCADAFGLPCWVDRAIILAACARHQRWAICAEACQGRACIQSGQLPKTHKARRRQALRHRRVTVHFIATLGNHAGAGLIASALLILYVFNRVIGSAAFWQAALGDAFTPGIAKICRGYLELLACYLIFIGALGLSITLARRRDVA